MDVNQIQSQDLDRLEREVKKERKRNEDLQGLMEQERRRQNTIIEEQNRKLDNINRVKKSVF